MGENRNKLSHSDFYIQKQNNPCEPQQQIIDPTEKWGTHEVHLLKPKIPNNYEQVLAENSFVKFFFRKIALRQNSFLKSILLD